MKFIAFLFLLIASSQTAFAQKNQSRAVPPLTAVAAKNDEEKEFARAAALTVAPERIAALQRFVENFLKSKKKSRNTELLARARAILADEKLRANDAAGGIALYKLALADAPPSVSDEFFNEVLIKIPNALTAIIETNAAIEIARLIESKTVGNAAQNLALARFYLDVENPDEAVRLANRAIQAQPEMSAAYQILGIAYHRNFDVAGAANLFTKALRLDETSIETRRRLAEMKRALGRTAQALTLYREILAKDENDTAARTGLILTLFDAGERAQAETEMQASLAKNPKNAVLLVGAAYWHAAKGEAARAVELANQALALEPQNVWARIALARGLMTQKRPLEAEKTLLAASGAGDSATLQYELATARLQAGLYREAAEDLAKNFTIKNGLIETKLGGRVAVEDRSFIELLAAERRASIFQATAADKPAEAEKLKNFLEFYRQLQTGTDEATLAAQIDEFVKGDAQMKAQRRQFAADVLSDKKTAPKNNLPAVAAKKNTIAADKKKTVPPPKKTTTTEEKTAANDQQKSAKAQPKTEQVAAVKTPPVRKINEKVSFAVKSESKKFSSCKLLVSRENIVIGEAGGNFAVLLKFEGAASLPEIKAVSSSPSDIEAVFDPEVGTMADRAFFIIKSNSEKTGVFTILFETPCGKKEISVTVL